MANLYEEEKTHFIIVIPTQKVHASFEKNEGTHALDEGRVNEEKEQ